MTVPKQFQPTLTKRELLIRDKWSLFLTWRIGIIAFLLFVNFLFAFLAVGSSALPITIIGAFVFCAGLIYFSSLEKHALKEYGSKFLIFDIFSSLVPLASHSWSSQMSSQAPGFMALLALFIIIPFIIIHSAYIIYSVELLFVNKDIQKRIEQSEINSAQEQKAVLY